MGLISQQGDMTDADAFSYERTSFPYDRLTRHHYRRGARGWFPRRPWWPAGIAEIRTVLPAHLIDACPPALAREGSWAVVAKHRGRPIGYAWVVPSLVDGTCYIEEVAVLAEYQGRGVGTCLIQRVAAWMQETGFDVATVKPLGPSRWLTRIGFREVDGTYSASLSQIGG